MTDKHKLETRLLTGATRPEEYDRIARHSAWRAANDDERQFRAAYRRKHWLLASIAWFGESAWRIAALILAAFLIGGVLDKVLP